MRPGTGILTFETYTNDQDLSVIRSLHGILQAGQYLNEINLQEHNLLIRLRNTAKSLSGESLDLAYGPFYMEAEEVQVAIGAITKLAPMTRGGTIGAPFDPRPAERALSELGQFSTPQSLA